MKLRSLLFVPGDRPERMEKALTLGADALILDLEDAVAPLAKVAARNAVGSFLKTAARPVPIFVRVNPLESALIDDDIAALSGLNPDGLVLPKAEGAASVEALARMAETVPILPIATETPGAIFQLGSYGSVRHLLLGLTWGAEDLPAAIGAAAARETDGTYTAPYEMVRSLTLFAGHAAGVPVIDTVFPDIRDGEGLERQARRARRDGFTGMLAIHPAQIPVINAAFTPSAEEIRHAQEIVEAFADRPGAGVLQVGGRMVDAPHLKQARRIIAMAKD